MVGEQSSTEARKGKSIMEGSGERSLATPPFYFFLEAALMNSLNNGCGSKGRDLSSGWN